MSDEDTGVGSTNKYLNYHFRSRDTGTVDLHGGWEGEYIGQLYNIFLI